MKKNEYNKLKKRHIRYYAACGIMTLSIPISIQANEIENQVIPSNTNKEAIFDSGFLSKDSLGQIDLDRFKYNNPILPGDYNVDIYVNGMWKRRQTITFKAENNKSNAKTCFTASKLSEFGVKQDVLKQKILDSTNELCLPMEEWITDAYSEFDSSSLRLDISIPQIALQQSAQGYVDPSQWTHGVNAGFLSYDINTYKSFSKQYTSSTNTFGSIIAGVNINGWQLRHSGQWQLDDQNKASYGVIDTYLQRDFPKYNARLKLGDSSTNGEIFDSFGYRGIDFSTQDNMLPNSMLGYAPRIRGFAKSNAKVEIRQNGQIIYQTTVAAGNFEVNDLNPTGFGGDLEVAVIEADGTIQSFSVPYSSVIQMLRPGMSRYSFTLGQFREKDIDLTPLIFQGKYQRGINNYLTGYGGVQLSKDYIAASGGLAIATPIGAIAFDVIHAQAKLHDKETLTGQSYKASYSKLFQPTSTYFSLAAYRYSTENYYSLRETISNNDLFEKGFNNSYQGKQRSEFLISLNQALPKKWGNFSLSGSWRDYWNKKESRRQYQIGYSNNYGSLNYSLSAIRHQIDNSLTGTTSNDTEYTLAFSFPLSSKRNAIRVNSITTKNSTNLGLSASPTDRFSYGASVTSQFGEDTSANINGQYITDFATVNGSYSYAKDLQSISASIRGNIIAHSQGINFGSEQGQTMVIVRAPNAVGASVNLASGAKINKFGYAVIPYATPYRLNEVSLDPNGMSTDVELLETVQYIAPYEGSISLIDFKTKSGKAIYIQATTVKGENLPFAAEIFNSNNENIGMVAQGSTAFIRTDKLADTITVKWGKESTDQCQIHYNINDLVESKTDQTIITTEAVCQ